MILLSINKVVIGHTDGTKESYLKVSANTSMSDFREYSVKQLSVKNNRVFYHIIIPYPINKVKLGFIRDIEEKLETVNLLQSEEAIVEDIEKQLDDLELKCLIKKYQEQRSGTKIGKNHYSLEELVEIKKYLRELGEL